MTMKIYQVGGCVRDMLLGIKSQDIDYVIVGAHEADINGLLSQGYKQVGAQFPVLLSPSNEEYALARKETKVGAGYHGFDVEFAPSITLEDDLWRRDLTINAIAKDITTGQIIDPYGGANDLNDRILRHVSIHFKDDPVRALRLARFAARYQHLGFIIHSDTKLLVREMIANGELDHLVPERVWEEFKKAFHHNFSGFVQIMFDLGILEVLLPEVHALHGVPQTEKYHPEVDTFKHIVLCLEQVEKLFSSDEEILWAVLLHDLGKGITPQEILPSHINHERDGLPLVVEVCDRFRVPTSFKDLATMVCYFHLDSHKVMEFKASTLVKRFRQYDAYRRKDRFVKFIKCCEADARGRTGFEDRAYPQSKYFMEMFNVAVSIKFTDLDKHDQISPSLIQQKFDEKRTRTISSNEAFKARKSIGEQL